MNKKDKASALKMLANIVVLTTSGNFLYTSEKERNDIATAAGKPVAELLEANPTLPDPTDATKIATRATGATIAAAAAAPPAPTTETTTAEKLSFEIESGIAIPAVVGRGRVGNTYPFDKMNVGDSFFVPKASNKLASTVSGAMKRFAEKVPGQTRTTRKGTVVDATKNTRTFIVRSDEKNGVKGSRIFRTA